MNQFQEYVTGQAFALTLSRRMCEGLEFFTAQEIHVTGFHAIGFVPNLPTVNALRERGLVESQPPRLSEAGRLIYPVLAHAGLVTPREQIEARIKGQPVLAHG